MLYSTRQQISEQIRDDILCGILADGKRLGEADLARRFAVSRGPIREALALLIQEGLLEFKPNCGVRVAPSAPADVCDAIAPFRRDLETLSLRLAHARLGAGDFQLWDDILGRMSVSCRSGDIPGVVRCEFAFHRHLLVRAGQADLLGIWQAIVGRMRARIWQIFSKDGLTLDKLHDDHRNLLAIFRQGTLAEAEAALAAHLS